MKDSQFFTPLILLAIVFLMAIARTVLDIACFKDKRRLTFVAAAFTGTAISAGLYGLYTLCENGLVHFVDIESFVAALMSIALGLSAFICRILTAIMSGLSLCCLILSVVSSRAELNKWFIKWF